MGAQQSSSQQDGEAFDSQPRKTYYYELLAVGRDATDDDIKRAYRKRALELHPDRNLKDVENATRRFAEVQTAYEVLSDPQERTWYDSHRDAILRGADPADTDGHGPVYDNVRLTSTENIFSLIRRFNASVPFTDDPSGFFGIVKATFDQLADEEIAAGEYAPGDAPDYPSFGTSSDSYEFVVKRFYSGWSQFSTRKTFSWKDQYRLSDAPDRRIRRLMEKENKKLREDAIRDFNDAVRFLVTFVRKRDSRYVPNTQTSAERQESMRNAAAAQAARSRAANLEKLSDSTIPEWAQSRDDDEHGGHYSDEDEEDPVMECIECVVCDKIFKSEKSFEAHEKSKKHTKAVQQLRRQMRDENFDLNLDDNVTIPENVPLGDSTAGIVGEPELPDHRDTAQDKHAPEYWATNINKTLGAETASEPTEEEDEYASRVDVEKRLLAEGTFVIESGGDVLGITDSKDEPDLQNLTIKDSDGDDTDPQPKKMGKAKAKREKKAARQAAEENHIIVCPPGPFAMSLTGH
ncbi:DnaJ-like protein subfamily C member 21 [Colletotrichum trifolii]|uniref:DnaJ-like protein subfamily C member 21 n=1 Tax=Colletotrichum trifolii TaxID=5466 RepID=A0A4R8PRI9_COLTR|nr:DnaJ-like protein subfamily C member 21 [Colletotrichum trifolii]